MNQKLITATAVTVIAVAGVAYLIFLIYTWNEMQKNYAMRYQRVDDLLDKATNAKPPE